MKFSESSFFYKQTKDKNQYFKENMKTYKYMRKYSHLPAAVDWSCLTADCPRRKALACSVCSFLHDKYHSVLRVPLRCH